MFNAVHRINFMTSFFKEAQKPLVFDGCTSGSDKIICCIDQQSTELFSSKKVFSIRLVPFYAHISSPGLKNTKIPQSNWSHAISLKGFKSVEEYLKSEFNLNSRKVIRRNIRRLETSFNIRYHLFHGSISDSDYHLVMNSLRFMIENRFEEKQEASKDLKDWESLQVSTLSKIRDKTASLFVIYNEQEPIEIALNYHFGDILFSSVSSFNTDYSKFGLGHIEIYKQLEWCIENGYHLFDMGVGGMNYKKKWCNVIKPFNHIICYSNGSISRIIGRLEIYKVRCKEYLKSKKINDLIYSFLSVFKSPTSNKTVLKRYSLKPSKWESFTDHGTVAYKNVNLVDINYLKRAVYEYLYLTQEHISDISIFEIKPETQFLIRGKQETYELYYQL